VSLIQQLQDDILDQEKSLATVLRKAKVLASILRNEELENWIENELNGYQGDVSNIPTYRRSEAANLGDFVSPIGGGYQNLPIPMSNIPEEAKEFASELLLTQGVRALESMIENEPCSLRIPWPAEACAMLYGKVFEGYSCFSAWKVVTKGRVVQVLDTVRNKLLDFVLQLQELSPEITESEEAISNIPKDDVASAITLNIFGNQNVVAAGSAITQEVHLDVRENDLHGLLQYMNEIGITPEDAEELREAVSKDPPKTEQQKFGTKVAAWVGNMVNKIAPALIVKGLSQYYGW